MAIAVDASTPARATAPSAATITTATFNPPTGAVLVACTSGDGAPTAAITAAITNNSTGLTWNLIGVRNAGDVAAASGGMCAMHYAVLGAGRTGMTVTTTLSGTGAAAASLQLYVVTGVDNITPLGANTEGSSATNNLTTAAFTTAGASSLGVVVAMDWNQLGLPTSADTTFSGFDTSGHISGGSGYKALAGAGASATFNLDAGGSGGADWNWVSAEFLADTSVPLVVPARPIVAPMQAAMRAASW